MSLSIRKPRLRGAGGSDYLASVSDLMSGLLFVFIITLFGAILQARQAAKAADEQEAVARQLQQHLSVVQARLEDNILQARQAAQEAGEQEAVARQLQERLSLVESRLEGNDRMRSVLLERLESRLRNEYKINVSTDYARGVLRIPESAVTFAVGSAELDASNAARLRDIGRVLGDELVCFMPGVPKQTASLCAERNPNGNKLDAVFIEGHTDNQVFRGDATGARNRQLSAGRSNTVYDVLLAHDSVLAGFTNEKGEALFSLSGYGDARPVPGHEHAEPTDDVANRRIELRFIFSEPRMSDGERALLRTRTGAAGQDREASDVSTAP